MAALLEATGADRWKIQREIEKLAAAAPDGAPITAELVGELVTGDVEVFALPNAIARKDLGQALVVLDKLLVGDHPLRVLATLTTMLRGYARIKALAERGLNATEIAKATGARSDFKVRKDLELLRKWKAAELAAALDVLLDVDLAIKEGRWPPDSHRILLERVVARMITPPERGIV